MSSTWALGGGGGGIPTLGLEAPYCTGVSWVETAQTGNQAVHTRRQVGARETTQQLLMLLEMVAARVVGVWWRVGLLPPCVGGGVVLGG